MLSCDWAALQQTHALEFIADHYQVTTRPLDDAIIDSRPLDDATIENTFEEQASTPSQVLPQKWKHSAYPKN